MKFTDVQTNAQTKKAQATPGEFAIPLVEVSEQEYQEPLALMVYGDPGSGKSRLIATAPDPIGVLPMERKSRQTILHVAQEFGKRIIMPEVDLIRSSRAMLTTSMPEQCIVAASITGNYKEEDRAKIAEERMSRKIAAITLDGERPDCCQRCFYRYHANRSKSVALRMAQRDDIRTIAIDTFGQLVDDILFACYGRNERIMPLDRKTFNQEIREFLNEISHKNLILTHHQAQIWRDNKPVSGKFKPMSSFSKIGHYATVMAKLTRDERNTPDGVELTYTLSIEDCQANASLIGLDLLTNDNITFANLANSVYPDAPEGYFE